MKQGEWVNEKGKCMKWHPALTSILDMILKEELLEALDCGVGGTIGTDGGTEEVEEFGTNWVELWGQ